MILNVRCYSQKDLRWAWKKVGFGNGRFWNVGCTVTALTGLLFPAGYDFQPDQVNERLKKEGAFTGNLILWKNVEKAFPKLKWIYRHYSYDNARVKNYVEEKMTPVMVEVMTRWGKHWVLYLGDHKMLDPLSGRVVSTNTYNPIGWSEFKIIY